MCKESASGKNTLSIKGMSIKLNDLQNLNRLSEESKPVFKSNKKNIFIVDAESDGLYGKIFAVGVIVACIDTCAPKEVFSLRWDTEIESVWVNENVVPKLTEIPSVKTQKELFDRFWNFYKKYADSSIIISDFGVPVESNLFRQCIEGREDRTFQGPYPLHELGTMMMMKGIDPDLSRENYIVPSRQHNPLNDVMGTLELIKHFNLLE